jgi:hypothetical protein
MITRLSTSIKNWLLRKYVVLPLYFIKATPTEELYTARRE